MQSPLKKIIVYDIETGGLKKEYNQITEIAMVVIDLELLEITDEFSVMFQPFVSMEHQDAEPYKEAKKIIKELAEEIEGHAGRVLIYKDQPQSLKTYKLLEDDLEEFYEHLDQYAEKEFTWEEYQPLLNGEFKDLANVYFDMAYQPQALRVTKMSKQMLLDEGLPQREAFEQCVAFIEKHTVGNSKPILAGHNIKKFDNPFVEDLFKRNGADLWKHVHPDFQMDTLDFGRLRWYELANFQLGTCANAIGVTLLQAHRALPDTIANAKFLLAMLKSLRGEGNQETTYVRKKYNFNF